MSSQQSNRPRPAEPAAEAIVKPHVVGAAEQFVGRIKHAGRVEIWGLVRGHVRALEVSVKHGGKIDGTVEANLIRNDGSVSGTARAQRMDLSRRSRFAGDLKAAEIGVEPGCRFGANTQVMTVSPGMIPVLTGHGLHEEIGKDRASGSGARPARPAEAAPPPPADAPRPFLVIKS